MKSFGQIIETQVHKTLRKKVRAATQTGSILNIIDSEINLVLTQAINQRLLDEQAQLLQRRPYQRSSAARYRNGFKCVQIQGFIKNFFVRKPVLRSACAPSETIALLRRFGQGMLGALASRFWLRGASTRATAQELNEVFGSKLSASDISAFTEKLMPEINAWLTRPITEPVSYLFLDAIYLPVRKPGFTSKQALLVALGVSPNGQRKLLGFLLGDRENIDSWSALLNDLLARGLDRSRILMAISDQHKAIVSSVAQVLGVPHQLCVIHKMRNVLARVSSQNRKQFYADFTAAFWAPSKTDAVFALGKLQEKWRKIYPKAVEIALADRDSFMQFFDQPKELWTLLRSTNILERFNRELRRRLRPAGAMHSENELWKLVFSIATAQEARWIKRKIRRTNTVKIIQKAA